MKIFKVYIITKTNFKIGVWLADEINHNVLQNQTVFSMKLFIGLDNCSLGD